MEHVREQERSPAASGDEQVAKGCFAARSSLPRRWSGADMNATLIAGIGSPHGADRLGWAVIEALCAETLPVPVNLVACSLPTELTPLLLEAPRAIVIDALLGSGPAGTIHQLRTADLPQAALRLSSHGVGLVDAVLLASVLGMPADRLCVLALDVVHHDADIAGEWITALVARVTELLGASPAPTRLP